MFMKVSENIFDDEFLYDQILKMELVCCGQYGTTYIKEYYSGVAIYGIRSDGTELKYFNAIVFEDAGLMDIFKDIVWSNIGKSEIIPIGKTIIREYNLRKIFGTD